jgi:hypothetical protein
METYCRDMETWINREMETRKRGDMETWRHGMGGMETRRYGNKKA